MSEYDKGILEFGDVTESAKLYLQREGYAPLLPNGRTYRIPADSKPGILFYYEWREKEIYFARFALRDGVYLFNVSEEQWKKNKTLGSRAVWN